MALSINLRGDLAKLSDAALAVRLEQAWQAYEVAEKREWTSNWWLLGKRGPIRHPRAYQFVAALQATDGGWISLLFAAALSHKDGAGFVRWADRTAGMHMSLCEIRDIIDEGERRRGKRPTVGT